MPINSATAVPSTGDFTIGYAETSWSTYVGTAHGGTESLAAANQTVYDITWYLCTGKTTFVSTRPGYTVPETTLSLSIVTTELTNKGCASFAPVQNSSGQVGMKQLYVADAGAVTGFSPIQPFLTYTIHATSIYSSSVGDAVATGASLRSPTALPAMSGNGVLFGSTDATWSGGDGFNSPPTSEVWVCDTEVTTAGFDLVEWIDAPSHDYAGSALANANCRKLYTNFVDTGEGITATTLTAASYSVSTPVYDYLPGSLTPSPTPLILGGKFLLRVAVGYPFAAWSPAVQVTTTLTADHPAISTGEGVSFTSNVSGTNMNAIFLDGVPYGFGRYMDTPNPFLWSEVGTCVDQIMTMRVYGTILVDGGTTPQPIWSDPYLATLDIKVNGDASLCAAATSVTEVSPSSGTTAGGTPITITGTGFSGSSVTVGGAACTSVVVVSASSITCTTPAGSAGAQDVVVTNSDTGTATKTGGFTFLAITSVGPSGNTFSALPNATVTVNSLLTNAIVVTGFDPAMNIAVTLTTTLGTLAQTSTEVTAVTGYQSPVTARAASISFSGTQAAVNAALATVTLRAPGAGTTATISVSASASTSGANSMAYNPANGHYYQYVTTPVSWDAAFNAITGGSLANGLTVFDPTTRIATASSACPYTFNGMCGYFATVTDAAENAFITSHVGTSPTWLGGSDRIYEGRWVWSDPRSPEYNTQFSSQSSTYTGRIDQSGTTHAGAQSSGTTGLPVGGSYVNWNNNEPNNFNGNENSLQILSGAGGKWNDLNEISGTPQFYVVEYGGNGEALLYLSASRTINVTFISPPIITSLSPSSGLIAGGTAIVITGTGFASGATVTIGGDVCTNVLFVSATSITCTIPARTAGAADVVVTNTDTGTGTYEGSFMYNFTGSFNSQGGSSISNATTGLGESLEDPGSSARSGYTFKGWFTAASGGSALTFPYLHEQTTDFTLFAQWTANSYTVHYLGDGSTGGTTPATQTYTTGTPTFPAAANTFVRPGYTFIAWNTSTEATGGNIEAGAALAPGGNLVLYAQWSKDPTPAPTPAPTVLKLKVYFDMGSFVIKGVNMTKLVDFASQIKKLGKKITITVTGYAQPTPGSEKTDKKLSADRANAVAKVLHSRGVTTTLTYQGMGRATLNVAASRYVEIVVR